MGRGGNKLFSMLALYSDDPSSNSADFTAVLRKFAEKTK